MGILFDLNEHSKFQGFVKIDPLRSFDNLRSISKKGKLLIKRTSKSVSEYIDVAESYEKSRERNFKGDYEHHYGLIIDILLPKREWTNDELVKFSSRYCKYITGEEKGLNYISWKITRGQAIYLKIYIASREEYTLTTAKKYKKDFYIHKITNKIVSKNDEMAILKCKKNELYRDDNGQLVFEKNEFKYVKSRRFNYKPSEWDQFKDTFREFMIQTLNYMNLLHKSYGKYFRRYSLKGAFNRYLRRIIERNNKVIQYIQNELNYYLSKTYRYASSYEVYRYGFNLEDPIETERSAIVLNLFSKYRKIFNQKYYEYENQKYHLYHTRVDIVESNLAKLKRIFNQDRDKLREVLL